jgi:hypothetical protein
MVREIKIKKKNEKLIRTHSALKEKKIMTFVGFGII